MDCKKIHYFASLYIDEMMSDGEKIQFEKHCEKCEDCKTVLENTRLMTESIKKISDVSLPSNFSASLSERLRRDINRNKVRFPRMSRKIVGLAATAAVILLFVIFANSNLFTPMKYDESVEEFGGDMAHGAPSQQSTMIAEDSVASKESNVIEGSSIRQFSADTDVEVGFAGADVKTDELRTTKIDTRKIIFSGNLSLEVDNFEQAYNEVLRLAEVKGGFVQNSNIYFYDQREDEKFKAANILLRIPKDNFKLTFAKLQDIGNVINQGISGDDVTDRYFDTEAAAKNLEIQEERLRKILEKAEKIEDVLRIENELSRIRLQINQLRGQLLNLNRHIEMSTISIDIREVRDLTATINPIDEGLWARAVSSLRKTINKLVDLFEKLFIAFFAALPIMAIVIMILLPVGIIAKMIWKRSRRD